MSSNSQINDSYESGLLSEPKTCSVASVVSFTKDISLLCVSSFERMKSLQHENMAYFSKECLLWAGSS